jgi:hypothetical protein
VVYCYHIRDLHEQIDGLERCMRCLDMVVSKEERAELSVGGI